MKIELITHETASETVKPLLDQVKKTYGFVPNTYGTFAHSPLAVAAYLQINGLIEEHSTLTPQEQQVVMLSVSVENACEYCVAAHTVVAGMVKTPPDAVASIRDSTPLADPRLAALSAFSRNLVKNRGWVPEAEQQAFLDAGFTIGQVFDVITIVGLKTLSNYANHLGDPKVDDAFASAAWKRPQA
ncbi:MAG: hypothetical protein CJBNEKGG_02720 [Prosthecobacter sp.]|nr:hypothetical protein [Prosthecobacter sp.]